MAVYLQNMIINPAMNNICTDFCGSGFSLTLFHHGVAVSQPEKSPGVILNSEAGLPGEGQEPVVTPIHKKLKKDIVYRWIYSPIIICS